MKSIKYLSFTIALAALSVSGKAFAHHGRHAPHVTINYDTGATLLSDSDEKALRTLVRQARDRDQMIETINVAAWSDKDTPENGTKLSETDELIASSRAAQIRDFLKQEMGMPDVLTFNMATNSNWLARAANTRDAELKSAFSRKGSDLEFSRDEFNVIEEDGGPSKAVIVVEFREIKASLAPVEHPAMPLPLH